MTIGVFLSCLNVRIIFKDARGFLKRASHLVWNGEKILPSSKYRQNFKKDLDFFKRASRFFSNCDFFPPQKIFRFKFIWILWCWFYSQCWSSPPTLSQYYLMHYYSYISLLYSILVVLGKKVHSQSSLPFSQ